MDSRDDLPRQLNNTIRLGTVAQVDLVAARCRVDTGDMKSDLVPWLVPRAGTTIEWSAPSVGEQVILLCPGGDMGGAVVLRGLYSDSFAAPGNSANQHITAHGDGAVIAYDDQAHTLTAILPDGAAATLTASGGITVNADSGVTINGPLTVNGDTAMNGNADVSDTLTAQTDVIGGGKSLKGHSHTGVQPGGGVSGLPQ